MAEFASPFESHSVLSKQLESRWFGSGSVGRRRHRMPFLRRNLSYVRSSSSSSSSPPLPPLPPSTTTRAGDPTAKNRRGGARRRGGGGGGGRGGGSRDGSDGEWQRRRTSSLSSSSRKEGGDGGDRRSRWCRPQHSCEPRRKTVNILLKLFKHHSHNVNPALLSTPVRSTRAMASNFTSPKTTTTTPEEDFLARQSSAEKVVRDVELAEDAAVRQDNGNKDGGAGCRRALVLAESPRRDRTKVKARPKSEAAAQTKSAGAGAGADPTPLLNGWSGANKYTLVTHGDDVGGSAAAAGRSLPSLRPPRPPRSAYLLFALSVRDDARRSLPRGPDRRDEAKIRRRIKKMWRSLDEKRAVRWVEEERAERERYEEERAAWEEWRRRESGGCLDIAAADGNESSGVAGRNDETKKLNGGCGTTNGSKPDGRGCGTTNGKRARAGETNSTKDVKGAKNGRGGGSSSKRARLTNRSTAGAAAALSAKAALAIANEGGPQKRPRGNMVYFHYFYLGRDGVPSVQVEARRDRRCPFCFFRYGTVRALLLHGRTCHGPHMSFEVVRDEDGNLHVRVDGDAAGDLVDGKERTRASSASTPRSDGGSGGNRPPHDFVHVRRRGRAAAGDDVDSDVAGPSDGVGRAPDAAAGGAGCHEGGGRADDLRGEEDGGGGGPQKHPLRQYYHSRTNLPMLRDDWEDDSDDEPDETWLRRMGEELMDEFDDVSADEKIFMKTWNRCMRSHTVISDQSIPGRTLDFVDTHRQRLIGSDLRGQLLCHTLALWDEGAMSADHILECMEAYDDAAATTGIVDGCGDGDHGCSSKVVVNEDDGDANNNSNRVHRREVAGCEDAEVMAKGAMKPQMSSPHMEGVVSLRPL